jgi:hypothetical protein
MRTIPRARRAPGRLQVAAGLVLLSSLVSRILGAQSTDTTETLTGLSRTLAAIASTPLGALTPVGPVMPTSRDDRLLFGFRLQYGSRALDAGRSLASYGLVTNLQIEGGPLLSGTVGYQRGVGQFCIDSSCDTNRLMAGIRYSNYLVTTRPFLRVPFFTENDATGTATLEFGAGWADAGFGERQHWTADITVPLSLAVGQSIRVVPFATPTFAVAWGTTDREWSRGQRFLVGGGVTVQEIGQFVGLTGLDVTAALQRAFSPNGTTLGITVSWMHVP